MTNKSFLLFFAALLTLISWQPVTVAAQDSILPKKLAIYYGYPSLVNGSNGNIDAAVNFFSVYDVVVFGDALQFPQFNNEPGQVPDYACNQNSHYDHDNTVEIINRLKTPPNQTMVYGYVTIGGENTARCLSDIAPPVPLSQAEIEERINAWAAMGVAGIFLDEAEYGFGTSRERQNTVIDYVHNQGLSVFINGFNPDDVFDTQVIHQVLYTTGYYTGTSSSIAMNPQGQPTHLRLNDIYLLEHFQIINGVYKNPDAWASRSDKMAAYQGQYGVQVATVTTPVTPTTDSACNSLFSREQFDYAWWSTLLYGFDFMSWGELWFSAGGACQNQLPFHDRPNAGEIGNAFTGPVAHPFPDDPPIYTRTTTTGMIEIDVAAHSGSFKPFDSPPPPSNNAPIAGDDTVSTHQDTPVTIAATDLLANDTDADGDTLSITSVATTSAKGGKFVKNVDNTYTYTPPVGISGTDSLIYTISDGRGGSATANVSITVLPGTPPVAADQLVDTNAETPVTITLTGSDADNDTLTFSVITQPTQGTLGGTLPNLIYTPNSGFSGADSFTFKVNDGTTDSNTATVNITVMAAPVNTPPVAADQSVDTNAETPVAITLTGSDADNDPLTFLVVTPPIQGTLNGTAPNYTYTPNPGFSGVDSFIFKVNDGTADSNTATVSITVNAKVATIGLYDPLTSAFHLKLSNVGGSAEMVYGYGPAGFGWLPVMGDWKNNGVHTAGLYDQRTGTFYLKDTLSGGKADNSFRYGPANAAWQPLIGDWNGDGTDTIGLYNPSSGTFYLKDDNSPGVATMSFRFGPIDPELIPLAGDWDGDGQDTVGLYHPRTGIFYLVNAHRGGKADLSFRYGPANAAWQPLAGDWNGDGTDSIGLYRPDTSQFYLRQSNTPGVADLSVRYGPAGQSWRPLVGKWQ